MIPRVCIIATRNVAKARELLPLLRAHGFDAVDLGGADVPRSPAENDIESFDSFSENALAKARYFNQLTGVPTFADDSGLVVPLLGAAPGVRSARWSGRSDLAGPELDAANNAALVRAVDACAGWDVAVAPPIARFVCAAAFCDGDGSCVALGEVAGHLLREPRGTNGFGYDPHFFSDEIGMSFGEADAASKARVSHRSHAFVALLASLHALRGSGGEC